MLFPLKYFCDDRLPYFGKPKAIGYYSLDGNKKWYSDTSQLNYYYPSASSKKNPDYDLNDGIENVIRDEYRLDKIINDILLWIKNNVDKVKGDPKSGKWLKADFVCRRGHLTTIMKSLYNHEDEWAMRVVKYKGTLYICQYDSEERKIKKNMVRYEERTYMSWGFKFEKYLLTNYPEIPPQPQKPVNEIESFHCVFKTRLNDKVLLYGAEIDGVEADKTIVEPLPLDKLTFVELKTSKIIEHRGQQVTFERWKLFDWWCQSFMVGIDKIICGFRNEIGVVKKIEQFSVSDISRKYPHYWSAEMSINLLDQFLQFVKDNVKDDYNETIYIFEKLPYDNIKMTKVPGNSEEHSFLPWWFTR